jgi:putative transposase
LRQKNWNVYAKKPFGSPHTVLNYLGRYTHRVALSNDRILKIENGEVLLSYRDRKEGDRKKTMVLEAHEFIRRFLLHVLPDGFMRIRHFGFWPTALRNIRGLMPSWSNFRTRLGWSRTAIGEEQETF